MPATLAACGRMMQETTQATEQKAERWRAIAQTRRQNKLETAQEKLRETRKTFASEEVAFKRAYLQGVEPVDGEGKAEMVQRKTDLELLRAIADSAENNVSSLQAQMEADYKHWFFANEDLAPQ